MARIKLSLTEEEIQALLHGDRGLARVVETICNEVLEAELAEHLGADRHERTEGRRGYRNGHYTRTLTTRVGTLELRVPRDREVRF